jgi:PIN domain nuclease of toxin-antitoxin system
LRLLHDTHIVVWAALDRDALTEPERRLLARADTPMVLSAVAVWELRLRWHSFRTSGERKGPVDPAAVVAAIDWEFLPLTAGHAAAEPSRPLRHKDPFDELLLVQAQEGGRRLLTRDIQLAGHPLAVIGEQE